MDKLLKTIESLKVPAFSLGTESNVPGSITSAVVAASDAVKTKKKERISHCVTVTDAVLNPSVQNLMDFPKILESVTEVLFQLCNDPDSDIRLVVVDCLNRIVRTLKGILLNKFQLEVYREIRKCQSPRSLRAALSVFATLSADIRPNRCRGFIQSLLPILVQISKRTEELLYENLSTSFLHILQNLGLYLTDSDVKVLCQEYLTNLESKSTVVRRSSAAILVYVCQYSRKPNLFLPRLLVDVIQLLSPSLMEKSISTLIGVLLCVRQCIPPLYAELEKPFPGIVDKDHLYQKIIQVYEICLILCNHDDHNVITTSLETLQQLLSSPVFEVSRRLTSREGIQNSFDSELWLRRNRVETPPLRPQSYWPSNNNELSEFDDPTSSGLLVMDNEFDLQTFRSELSSTVSDTKDDVEINIIHSSAGSRRNSVFMMATTSDAGSEPGSDNSLDLKSDDDVDCGRLSTAMELDSFPELHIGSLYDANVPLYYCTRFLAYNFLLAGKQGHQRSDKEVRVTVKALAINCIINSIRLCPVVYFLPLSHSEATEPEKAEDQQKVSDVALYCKHHDPLLRGSTYLLISHFLSRILRNNHGVWGHTESEMEKLLSILNSGLLDQSNIGVKYALSGLTECLVPILRNGSGSSIIEQIFHNLFAIVSNPYWLVKVNLIELLASIEYDCVPNYAETEDRTLNLFLLLLSDEDVRVRSSSVSALIKFIGACGKREDWILGRVNPFSLKPVIDATKCDICRLPGKERLHSNLCKYLEKVLDRIIPQLSQLHEKHSIASFYSAFSSLAETFPPSLYLGPWRCNGEANELPFLFSVTVDMLRSASIVSDIYVHQNLLSLSSSLLIGLIQRTAGAEQNEIDENCPFLASHKTLTFYGLYILNHCYAVVKLYHNLLKPHMESVVPKKQSPLSPAKKLLGKEKDVEKKAASVTAAVESEKKSKQLQRQQSNSLLGPNICQVQLKRIEDSLHQSWKIYKSNLDPVVTHKFTLVLVTSLDSLGSIFAYTRHDFAGLAVVIEDILAMSPVIFNLAPVPTLKCTKEILRCLNPSPHPNTLLEVKNYGRLDDSVTEFETFCENFYKNFPASRRSGLVLPPEKSSLGAHIRSFEPIVITALKSYLSSSDSSIQAEILLFVTELIKGHVNYAMVDSNQVFLTAVIKQLTFLEEGQFRDAAIVVDAIFDYFTHLSHTERLSRKFVDTPKLLQLCDGLVASGQNPATNYIPAMKKIVYDLFIRQGSVGITNLERKEIEAQREVLFQNSIKLLHVPDVLPMLFLLIHGRRGISEAKWSTESGILAKALLETIESNRLIINNSNDFRCLVAVLFSVHAITLPSLSKLTTSLETSLQSQVDDPSSLLHWMATINTFWLVIFRTVHCNEDFIPSRLLLDIFLKLVQEIQSIFTWTQGKLEHAVFIEQLVIFIKVSCSLLCKESSGEAIAELTAEDKREEFSKLAKELARMSLFYPELRKGFCEFLTVLAYPYTPVWDTILSSLEPTPIKELFLSELVPALVKRLLPTTDPVLETWLIENYAISLIQQSKSPEVTSLWTRLSDSSRDFLMKKLIDISDEPNLSGLQVKSILCTIEVVFEKYKVLCAMVCVKLLQKQTLDSILFEVSQFACFLFVQLQGQEETFSEDERRILTEFSNNSQTILRFPRLVSLVNKCLSTELDEDGNNFETQVLNSVDMKDLKEDPILSWCCEEINSPEGVALAQILSTLKYTQILSIFSHPNFNLSVLKYVIRHLHVQVLQEQAPLDDLVTLLTTENHSNLIEKLPLGVAALDYIVEKLDNWETLISDDVLTSPAIPNILDVPFREKLCDMWSLLTELLRLKAKVLAEDATWREKSLHNNYIPTKVFTFSFQYMRAFCQNAPLPIYQLTVFLEFACAAIQDLSFLQFFDVRDHHVLLFNCVRALGSILRLIVAHFRIPYVAIETEDTWCELNEECIQILRIFNFMLDVIWKVKAGHLDMEVSLYEPLKTLIAGLAKCELVNGWILICHLGWKPPLTNKDQIFPPILHIPLETLQNERDLLIKYISKLNFFGIASKIQFEENWMTFLSVINSFGDENHNIQIIIVGLQALSMMLEQSVKVVYTMDTSTRKLASGLRRINTCLSEMEPPICQKFSPALPHGNSIKTFNNKFNVDITSCIRFLIDLFSQWMQNIQGKMPLILISKVVENIVNISKYFDDTTQYIWMFDTLMEINKGCEKEDDILWTHLIHGIFVAASKFTPEPEVVVSLGQTLEAALASPSANVANAALETALEYFQNQPESLPLLNIVIPYVLNCTQLSETLNDTEAHSYSAWKLLLYIWIHCSSSGAGGSSFEQDILGNVLTVLSPLNKVHVSIRVLVLQSLRTKVEMGGLKPEVKKIITKVALDTFKTPNIAIFYESIKLFLTIFYYDFAELYHISDPDPELLMQVVERSEVLFLTLKNGKKFATKIASKVLPILVTDFLPPSEILNRAISQFLSPAQTAPELLAPTITQIFEKARRKPREAILVREWIIASLPNFIASADVSRSMWNLTVFFVGISTTPEVFSLLPFAQLRRNPAQIRKLFIHSALDYYSSLTSEEQETFEHIIRKGPFPSSSDNPYSFLLDLIYSLKQ